jgi:chromosome segregation ATPase
MGLRTRTALAAAGRTRGLETPYDDTIERLRKDLAELRSDLPHGEGDDGAQRDGERNRRRAAEADAEIERLREEVAAARGRLRERREQGIDPTPAAESLADAIGRLADAETRVSAAEQQLADGRERRERLRDHRERCFRLEDRVANLRRDARAYLVSELEGPFRSAMNAVPGFEDSGDSFDAPAQVRALAVARVADLEAPLVLSNDPFETMAAASNWIGTPIVRV